MLNRWRSMIAQRGAELRSSLWFVPAVCVAGAICLALLLIDLGERIDRDTLERWPWLFGVGPDGSRAMLATVAGSMVTVAGVVFSIVIVALSLASSQYSSRVLRTFLRDRATKAVLGIMVGVFAYCLVVLRTIREGNDAAFVPQLAVQGAVLLAFVGLGAFIYFIHHVATTIQVAQILVAIREEADEAVEHLFPQSIGEPADALENEDWSVRAVSFTWAPVLSRATGYVDRVDSESLMQIAIDNQVAIRMEVAIGDFVVEDAPIVSITEQDLNGESEAIDLDKLRDCYVISPQQTAEQDLAFTLGQMVDVALKALSPGVNDTTTAVTCLDHLVAVLSRLARRRDVPPYREENGQLRVIAIGPTFESLTGRALDQIRQNAGGNTAVLRRLMTGLATITSFTDSPARRRILYEQFEAVLEVVARTVPADADRESLEQFGQRALRSM